MVDGTPVEILVQHAGETEYGTVGLTTDPHAVCNPDGTTTGDLAPIVVNSGVVEFYTCGASNFLDSLHSSNGGGTQCFFIALEKTIHGTVGCDERPLIRSDCFGKVVDGECVARVADDRLVQ